MTAACVARLERRKGRSDGRIVLLILLLPALELFLQLGDRGSIVGTVGNAAILQSATIESWAIVIEALANHLTAAHNNGTMSVVKGRLLSLLHAQREVIVRLHFDLLVGIFG